MAALLQPGNAGSNTASDHIEPIQLALAELPGHLAEGCPSNRPPARERLPDSLASSKEPAPEVTPEAVDKCLPLGLWHNLWESRADPQRSRSVNSENRQVGGLL